MSLYKEGLLKELEENLKKHPDSKSFSTLAQIYYDRGDKSKAKSLCLEGLKRCPSHLPAYLLLAEIEIKEGQIDTAIQYLNKAKEIQPKHPGIYEKLAQVYTSQGKVEEVLQAYKTLAMLQPNNQMALDHISYLEKIAVPTQPLQNKDSLSQKKLFKLNQILARVDNFIQKEGL